MSSQLARAAKEMDRLAQRYSITPGRFWVYFRVGDLRINVETNEATYRAIHEAEWPDYYADDITHPLEPTWWHTKQVHPFIIERGGWIEEA